MSKCIFFLIYQILLSTNSKNKTDFLSKIKSMALLGVTTRTRTHPNWFLEILCKISKSIELISLRVSDSEPQNLKKIESDI
jgi:hypothetical protein